VRKIKVKNYLKNNGKKEFKNNDQKEFKI